MMINTVIFDDEITLYWDKQWELSNGVLYRTILNGVTYSLTKKTHVTFDKLTPQTEYSVRVERLDEAGEVAQVLFDGVLETKQAKVRIDVTKPPYNAVGDGKTLNTQALQRAFDDCKENQAVYLPKGIYLTGALDMHANSELYLDENAILQGTASVADYAPKRHSRFEGIEMECYSALINIGTLDYKAGYTTQNIVIRGKGCVFGGGKELAERVIESERERLKEFMTNNADYVKTCENERTLPGRARPRLVAVSNAQNVIFTGVTFGYGASWNIHMTYCKDVLTYRCCIRSMGVWNGDGWDPDSSENCTIFACEFITHDDAIAIKSGKNPEGNTINRPTKNVRVFDCYGKNGIAIGSEMSGGVIDVYIWDCDFLNCYSGFILKATKERGGYVKNVKVKNCRFALLSIQTSLSYNNDGQAAPTIPVIENIAFENIGVKGISAWNNGTRMPVPPISFIGFENEENYLNNVTIKDVFWDEAETDKKQKVVLKNIKNLTLEDVNL